MEIKHRRLPHWYKSGYGLFVTWCLHGSLRSAQYAPARKTSAGQAFASMDRYLDTTRSGPLYLKDDRVAELVEAAILRGATELEHYELDAYVIMANHVHLLVVPRLAASKFLKSLKGYTARQANQILRRTGQPFWQAESYDRWVRDEREHRRISAYIENNPVKAGLFSTPEAYRWSSAFALAERVSARVPTRQV